MEILRTDGGADFLREAEAFLVTQEAANCLVLGIAIQLALYPDQAKRGAYLGVAKDGDQVLAAAVMTPPNRLVLSTSTSPAALAALAADVASFLRTTSGASGPTPGSLWLAETWRQLTGDTATPGQSLRIYQATQITPPPGVPGSARRAGGSDRELLIEWFTAFELEAFGNMGADMPARVDAYLEMSTRGVSIWEDGGPVAMAGYSGYTPHGARVGPVYTPPSNRGRGYGSAITAWLSQHLLDRDRRFCCLFADQANRTANHIYQTIGYAPVCDIAEFNLSTVAA